MSKDKFWVSLADVLGYFGVFIALPLFGLAIVFAFFASVHRSLHGDDNAIYGLIVGSFWFGYLVCHYQNRK